MGANTLSESSVSEDELSQNSSLSPRARESDLHLKYQLAKKEQKWCCGAKDLKELLSKVTIPQIYDNLFDKRMILDYRKCSYFLSLLEAEWQKGSNFSVRPADVVAMLQNHCNKSNQQSILHLALVHSNLRFNVAMLSTASNMSIIKGLEALISCKFSLEITDLKGKTPIDALLDNENLQAEFLSVFIKLLLKHDYPFFKIITSSTEAERASDFRIFVEHSVYSRLMMSDKVQAKDLELIHNKMIQFCRDNTKRQKQKIDTLMRIYKTVQRSGKQSARAMEKVICSEIYRS